MEIEWPSLFFGTILGGIVSFLITKWGIKKSFKQEAQMRAEENMKRWQRWFAPRPPLAEENFDHAKNADLIYEIRDWAESIQCSLEGNRSQNTLVRKPLRWLQRSLEGNRSQNILTEDLKQYDRRIHLSSIASLLVFHEFPEELEKDILDLYIQTEYVFETVQNYISDPKQIEPDIICLMAESVAKEARALLKKAEAISDQAKSRQE